MAVVRQASNEPPSSVGTIDFAGWLIRLLTWDGVLPACLLMVPSVIERVFPNRGAIQAAAVVLPIAFFFWRIAKGCRYIDANHCSPAFQKLQVWALVLAVFMLLVFEAAMIAVSDLMPKGGMGRDDVVILSVMLLIYLAPMAFAMYPGRSNPLPEVWRPENDR